MTADAIESTFYAQHGIRVLTPSVRYWVPSDTGPWAVEYVDLEWWCDCPGRHGCCHIKRVIELEGILAERLEVIA